MNLHYLKHFLLVAMIIVAGSASAQTPMSLSDCILIAYYNNPNIRIAQLQIADADWQIKENKASGLPQLSASASYQYFIQRPGIPASIFGGFGPPDTSMAGPGVDPDSKIAFAAKHNLSGALQYNQLLFSNSYLIALRAAKYYREYTNIQLTVAKQTVRNQVTDAYLPALLLTENLALVDKNIANLERLLNETQAINKAGFAEQLDVDRLELSLSTLRGERGNLARQQEMVVNALKMTMGMPVTEPLALSDNLDKLLGEYADADMTSAPNFMARPEYLQLLKGRELSALQVDLNSKPWMPTVAGFVQYSPGFQGGFTGNDRWFWIPSAITGLSVTIPIWDGGGAKARRERANIGLQTLDAQKAMLENALLLELENARKQYLNAQERVKNQQKNLDLAQRIYTTTQTKYKAGVGSSFEMITAEQGLYGAQQSLTQARFDQLAARVAIKRALGAEKN